MFKLFELFRKHHKKFKNPYPPIPHPSKAYRLKEQIYNNTERLLPLIHQSSKPETLKKIIWQLNRSGYASLMLMKNEIIHLPSILRKNELIGVASSGNLNGENELLLLTNQRFLFVHYDIIKKQCHHLSLPLDQVVPAVYHHNVIATNTVTIGKGGTQLDIRGVEDAPRFAKKMNHYLG